MCHREEMNKEALDLMDLPDEDDDTHACTIRPQFDTINGTVNKHAVFWYEFTLLIVDRSINRINCGRMVHACVSSSSSGRSIRLCAFLFISS